MASGPQTPQSHPARRAPHTAFRVCEESTRPWVVCLGLGSRRRWHQEAGDKAAVTRAGAGPRSRGTRVRWLRTARRAHDAGRAAGQCCGPAPRTPRTASLAAGRSPAGETQSGGTPPPPRAGPGSGWGGLPCWGPPRNEKMGWERLHHKTLGWGRAPGARATTWCGKGSQAGGHTEGPGQDGPRLGTQPPADSSQNLDDGALEMDERCASQRLWAMSRGGDSV